jgi:ketosteroid isomerase-like protein
MEKQIAQIMNTWVEDWNNKRIDDLTKLYYPHAVLLPADGSRADGQSEIRAYLEKQVGTKMELSSPGAGFICLDNKGVPTVAIESGTYKQSGTAKTVEGRDLVLVVGGPTWVIAQQALTAKPEPQTLSRNLDEGTR